MIDPLFSVFLSKVGDAAIGWGVGRALDVVTKCYRCTEPSNGRIGNQQLNFIECRNCHATVHQYTHACEATIRPVTLQVAHASIGFLDKPYDFAFTKVSTGLFSSTHNLTALIIPYHLELHALQQRTAKLEFSLSDVNGVFLTSEHVVAPSRPVESFDLNWNIRSYRQYGREDRAIDFYLAITTDSNQLIAEHRRFVMMPPA